MSDELNNSSDRDRRISELKAKIADAESEVSWLQYQVDFYDYEIKRLERRLARTPRRFWLRRRRIRGRIRYRLGRIENLERRIRGYEAAITRWRRELERLKPPPVAWCEFLASVYVKYVEQAKRYEYRVKETGRKKVEHKPEGERVFEARGLFVARFEEYEKALEKACDDVLLPWLLDFVEHHGRPVMGWRLDQVTTDRARHLDLTNGGRILVEKWRELTPLQEEENEYSSDQQIYDVQIDRIVRDPAAQRTIILRGVWWRRPRQALLEEFLK